MVIYIALLINANSGSIIDSGAARHVSPKVHITDGDNRVKLTSFTGKESWTEGNGYIPMTLNDDLSGHDFSIDIEDADYSSETVTSLLSLCKLLRASWRFELSLGSLYGYTPTGHRVTLSMGNDDVLRLPHETREGDELRLAPQSIHVVMSNILRNWLLRNSYTVYSTTPTPTRFTVL